jgi:hypothetical protein
MAGKAWLPRICKVRLAISFNALHTRVVRRQDYISAQTLRVSHARRDAIPLPDVGEPCCYCIPLWGKYAYCHEGYDDRDSPHEVGVLVPVIIN